MPTSEKPDRDLGYEATHTPVVLNVNDNEAARYMTGLMLRRAGFSVLEAADGRTALKLVEQQPDVVVLDVRLPDLDGFEVCRRIRSNPKTSRIKVLHTSATFVTVDKKIQGLEMGADGYLAQPFEVQELVATVQSLVRLRRAEQGLHRRAEQLVEASERKDEFLAMLAHELRNPLSAISASLPLLTQHDPANAVEARAREILARQVSHLGKLVDDLLDVARVTRGKIELHKTPLDLGALIERVVMGGRETMSGPRQQTLTLHLPKERILIDGDATRLEQVFTNLLDNASKYTPQQGSIRIEVEAQTAMDMVKVRVIDSGIGIAGDNLPVIFELFSQGNVPIDRSRGGLGIGLTLVRTLVELHGGKVTAQSAGADRGTCFEVSLPLLRVDHAQPSEASRAHAEAKKVAARKVLLVDDNLDALESLTCLSEMWGHQVLTATDGLEAVQLALKERPDIAFIDIGLPQLNGYEVAMRVRREAAGKNLTLVALTGYGSPEHRQRALEAGFDHHLVKPIDTQKMQRLIEG